jgi:uncharacterized protein (TIRG00374 family)
VKKKTVQALQFIIFFGLGGGLMYWQFSGFSDEQREQFYNGLRNANYGWFVVALIIGMLAHLMRAIRWQMLLTPLGRQVGLGTRFYAVMIGYLANYAFPRLGEVVRPGVLKTSDDIPLSESFGTVVVERIVDLLCLGVIFLIVLLVQFAELQGLFIKYIWDPASVKLAGIASSPLKMAILVGGILLLVAVILFVRKKVGGKAKAFFTGLKDGILSVRKVKRPFLFILQSLLIWLGYYLALYVVFFCFPETSNLTLNSALVLVLFGTFGVAFTPGGIGAYHIIIAAIIVDLSPASEPAAASFAWLSWGAQVVTVIIFTGIAFAIRPMLNRTKL